MPGETGPENRTMLMTVTLMACRMAKAAAPTRCAAMARAGRPPSSGQRRASFTANGVRIASMSQNGSALPTAGSQCTGGPPIVERR